MRFAIPPTQVSRALSKWSSKDWPLALRFAVLAIPPSLVIALISLWLGWQASSKAFYETLQSVPLLEVKSLANGMTDTLNQLRHSLFRIAQHDIAQLRDDGADLGVFFHENAQLVQELGFKDNSGGGFVLLRDANTFSRLSALDASQGPYSPFQQITSLPVHPGGVTIFPPVFFDDPNQPAKDTPERTPVMRMVMALPDGSGVLTLGINMVAWRNKMNAFMHTDSPFRLPIQQGALQLAFFFDTRGWILFEMGSGTTKSFLPDLSREGYGGDLGRAGYDTAFRPWAAHHNYWAMVTDVTSGRAGSASAPADKYLPTQVGSKGMLSYAPVMFAGMQNQPPSVIGGIAFFETTALPLSIFLRLANFSLALFLVCLACFGIITYLVHKKGGKPISLMAESLRNMADSGKLEPLRGRTVFYEHYQLVFAANRVLAGAIETNKELASLTREINQARERLPVDLGSRVEAHEDDDSFGLVGSSSSIRDVREHIGKAAKAGTDVLIWGETGTGKELVAAAIHKASSRRDAPYISINCGALDENLLLDALFGHVKGAFSEAKADRKGAFLAADGGTLHLDEVANASPKVQQSLLRALSVRRIRPLGTDSEVPFTTKVVAATNVDLRECVRAGTFREDLYYRLAIISIETPPLRHRKEDIPELAACFIHETAHALGRKETQLSRGAFDLMYSYDWPGNVREFKNCITRAMAFVDGDLILPQHITLEQDAFSNYARPLPPEILADRLHPVGTPPKPASRPPAKAAGQQEAPLPEHSRATSSNSIEGQSEPVPLADAAKTGGGQLRKPQQEGAPPAAHESGWGSRLHEIEGLNDRQLRALEFVRKKGQITRPEYENVVGKEVSPRTAQNDLRELVERGILQRIGGGPGTRYVFDDAS